jgi:hypothetical protein
MKGQVVSKQLMLFRSINQFGGGGILERKPICPSIKTPFLRTTPPIPQTVFRRDSRMVESTRRAAWLLIPPSRLNLSEYLSQSLFSLVRRLLGRVCDCQHCVEPLNIKRQAVKDVKIRSIGYDRRRGRLEIEFTWTHDVRQFLILLPPGSSSMCLAYIH